MRRIVFISLLLICTIEISCNNTISKKEAKSKLQNLIQMPISDSIEITGYATDMSIQGDHTEIFVVHFKKDEFEKIFKKINPRKLKNIDANIYGYSVEKGREMTSAIFDPQKCTIKYTSNYE